MIVYRITKEKYKDSLSGYGASLNGNRWNSKGTEVIYTAESISLATCEVAVHASFGLTPKDYWRVDIEINDSISIYEYPINNLPDRWDAKPHIYDSQLIGDAFSQKRDFCVMKVPSASVEGCFNFVLNPLHPEFTQIKIINTIPFNFDERLFRTPSIERDPQEIL